ncbi:MAG: ACT domain-containing protein [Candidatus Latescibacteria bacterium]|nr:ACT domain-containing protein [Candidatus Latescibacterota bacterium]
MSSESDLNYLLKSMNPVLHDGEFVFCTLSQNQADRLPVKPVSVFRENEGVSVVLSREQAEQFGISYNYISRMIVLTVHSSLDAVGFLAAVTGKLAEHGISVNPVSAYFHDYLFVPSPKAEEAIEILAQFTE